MYWFFRIPFYIRLQLDFRRSRLMFSWSRYVTVIQFHSFLLHVSSFFFSVLPTVLEVDDTKGDPLRWRNHVKLCEKRKDFHFLIFLFILIFCCRNPSFAFLIVIKTMLGMKCAKEWHLFHALLMLWRVLGFCWLILFVLPLKMTVWFWENFQFFLSFNEEMFVLAVNLATKSHETQ